MGPGHIPNDWRACKCICAAEPITVLLNKQSVSVNSIPTTCNASIYYINTILFRIFCC